jgi:GNAT superfamily N-acetyltransferase
VEVRSAVSGDVDVVVRLAAARRTQYETYQPVLWRPAADAAARQRPYLAALIDDPAVISLVAVTDRGVAGFAIATLAAAPPVYDPGGLTCLVDDFSVADPRDWPTVGVALLRAVSRAAQDRGAAQVVVVTAQQDEAKRAVLAASGLSVASEGWVRPVNVE